MGETVIIISDGEIKDKALVADVLAEVKNPVVICADGALRHLEGTGIVPRFIVGDMDSADEAALQEYARLGSAVERHSAHKDETDTELALARALAMDPAGIIILGALGGRIDHALANVGLLVTAAARGVDAVIRDDNCELRVVRDALEVRGRAGETVSLLPLSSEVAGITLSGFEYPLTDAVLKVGVPLGISNRLKEDAGMIRVKAGYLLVVHFFGEVD